ncbi:ammonium transporter [Salinicola acroporae]|uniref:Ammonia permease n=1 Tax=Salinicola acroporae TaxID=1541440 RepID=A0ABT6I3K9_9GAMM|nr:ammonium transporter [Salinicola acroporae]MDH4572231.1 ammonia permease [Salinicola acroporae]
MSESVAAVDALWVTLGAILVFMMQAGFLCLEAGVTRSKNAINVAMKNVCDFAVAMLVFWCVGFGIMFGSSQGGWFGTTFFFPEFEGEGTYWLAVYFLFQVMFCATAATIVSGAVAERMPFQSYLLITLIVSGLIYPVFGHWAWGGGYTGEPGWLAALGFVDFAGSTVVHSVGGWVALAAVLRIGPRRGRFVSGQATKLMPAGDLPLAMLGVLVLFIGWFGFNGGSTLAFDASVPGVLINTVIAAVSGVMSALLLGWKLRGFAEVLYALNGAIAGLVAITAGAHDLSVDAAVMTGAVGGVLMVLMSEWLLRWRIDDAVGAIPAHLAPGIWGTLAVGLFGDADRLGTGLGWAAQCGVQLLGVVVCGLWAFLVSWLLFGILGRWLPLRVSAEAEEMGLNMAEHGARTELFEFLDAMRQHEEHGEIGARVAADPFTEVGQIAASYNRVSAALERAMTRTQVIMRNLRDGMLTWRSDGVLTAINPGAEALFGVSAETVMGTPVEALIRCRIPAPGQRRELRVLTAAGPRSLEIQVSEGASGSEAEFAGMVRDITERKRIEEQLSRERELALVTLASIGDGVITTDHSGLVTFLNAEAERLTGWTLEAARQLPVGQIYSLIDEASNNPIDNTARQVLASGKAIASLETRLLVARDGSRWPVQDSAAPIRSRGGYTVGAVVVFQDKTLTRELTRKLNHQASHDALTGLVNRREFERRLQAALLDARGFHVLCYLDLDQFKIVNDTCGHRAGDELLRQLSMLLRAQIRDMDLLARLGGDEFGIVFFECDLDDALRVAEGIREAIDDFRFSWEGRTFALGASIGLVALDVGRSVVLSEALSTADAACYAAKEAGRNRVHVYQPDDRQLLDRHGELQWVPRLQAALDQDRLRLYAQSIASVANPGDIHHHEILVRLEENGRLYAPGSFMPSAERYNLIVRIDRWVVRNTLAWLSDRYRHKASAGIDTWSMNLSGASLSDERFCKELALWVKQAALPAGTLCFEITESAAISQLSTVTRLIHRLKRWGCRFALDDFGAGLSSFAYLKQLPVDYLKIDGAFIKDIDTDPINRAMVEAINTVGHTVGLKTIAEFVETPEVMAQLSRLGIDFAQGYLIDRPQPLENLSDVRVMPR